jgi:hypothetical protein
MRMAYHANVVALHNDDFRREVTTAAYSGRLVGTGQSKVRGGWTARQDMSGLVCA